MNKTLKLDKTNIEDIVDLTSLQEGILFHYLKDESKNLYFVQLSLEIQGVIKSDYFQKAWNKVVDNNEMLRTVYRWEKLNKPVQVILKEKNVDIRYYDLSKEESTKESEYQKIKLKDSEKNFDLREVPFRLTLCKFKTDKYSLLISNHHIIYDGWSNGIILKEFLNFYNELVTVSTLKINKKTSFKNYLKFNHKPSTEDESFWKDYLKGFELKNVFGLKSFNSIPDNSNNQSHRFSISEDKFSKLNQLCKSQKLTIADILYSAWGILLSKYSGESDILFGTTISGRNIKFEGIEQMVGLFINTIPIRIRITPDKPLISVLKENAKRTLGRGRFENVPLRNILDYSAYKENELIESIFVVENYPLDKENLQHQDELAFKAFSIQETTNYKLTVSALISDEIEISLNYINAYFQKELIENIEKHYIRIIDRIINDNKTAIQSLDLLSDIEKNQLLYEFNNTKADYPSHKTIQKLLEEQILINPESTAVYEGEKKLSYKELGYESDCFAEFLLKNGVKKNDVIPILLDRSVNVIIAILGILKSGGIFLPIDISSPKNRILYILEDSDNKLILTSNEIWNNLSLRGDAIFTEDIFNYKERGLIDSIITSSSDWAYVIYTSGTTGNPKGTLLGQKGLVNYITWANKNYVQGEKLDFPLFTSLAFDLTITSIFTPLISGNGIVIYNESYENEILLNRILDDNKVGVIKLTPSHLKVLKERDNTKLNLEKLKLKRLIVGGEQLNTELAFEIFNKYSEQVDIYNEYGPTEATIGCSICKFDKKRHTGISVPIGRPITNFNIFVLDNEQNLLPVGISGELCIAGVGLAMGYLGLPELTSEKFIEHPFKERARLYRTGDLARLLPDGNIEFLGRVDHQVKIRGFRIELGEIQTGILKYSEVKECVVLCREDQGGEKYLCAYVVSSGQGKKLDESIRAHLSGLLPDYMIPTYIVKLDSIPLTAVCLKTASVSKFKSNFRHFKLFKACLNIT
ncbi:MAG: amino acid adenylation domain-containing protein [Bacteroidales bacterium]|nr:amino acid adenylation domain-containing protein [Bacteroidales bacterium]